MFLTFLRDILSFGNWLWVTYSTDRKLSRTIKHFLCGFYCIYMYKILFLLILNYSYLSVCESWYKGSSLKKTKVSSLGAWNQTEFLCKSNASSS